MCIRDSYLAERGAGAEDTARRTAPLVQRKMSRLSEYDGLAGWLYRPLQFEPEAWDVRVQDVKHSIQVIGGGLELQRAVQPPGQAVVLGQAAHLALNQRSR